LTLPGPLEKLRLSLGRRFLGLGKPKDAGWWNRSYAAGTWDGLTSAQESARLRAASWLLDQHRPPGTPILDVGCGPAPLYPFLLPDAARCWIGTDISAEAIERAHAAVPPGTPLFVESAEGPVPPSVAAHGPFGAILFSEVLYYLREPLETLDRYGEHLLPQGCFVISLWNPPRHRALRWRLRRRFDVVSSVTVAVAKAHPWVVVVARRRARPPVAP